MATNRQPTMDKLRAGQWRGTFKGKDGKVWDRFCTVGIYNGNNEFASRRCLDCSTTIIRPYLEVKA